MSDLRVKDDSLVSRIGQRIRTWSVPIALVWLLIAVATNVFVPQLEEVGEAHTLRSSSPGLAVAAGDETHRARCSASSIPTAPR